MDSRIERDETLKNQIVALGCLLGAACGGFYLYRDLHEIGRSGTGLPVGKVEKREAKVRRKTGQSFVWSNVRIHEEVYRKDSIQTGAASAASIRLSNGSSVDVGENSLVVMDDTTELALRFVRGTAVIHKKDGDAKVTVGRDGKTKVEELPARLLKPEPMERYFIPDQSHKVVQFNWEGRTKGASNTYTFEVSNDRRFPQEITQKKSFTLTPKDTQTQITQMDFGPGIYYWRVLAKGVSQTEIRYFKVVNIIPVQTIFPAHQQKVEGAPGDGAVRFRWVIPRNGGGGIGAEESDFSLGENQIEIAQDIEFKKIVQSEPVTLSSGYSTLHGLPEGTLYWRIRSTYPNLTLRSGAKLFTYRNAPLIPVQPLLPFPTLVKPENGGKLSLLDEKNPPELSWSVVEGAMGYDISIYQITEAGKKEVLHTRTNKNILPVKSLGLGQFSWTLQAMDRQKKLGEPLPLRTFKIEYGEILAPPEDVTSEVQ